MRLVAPPILALTPLLLAACATSSSQEAFEWAPPPSGWFWVPKGTDPRKIIEAATECGAGTDGAVAHHRPVPEGYDWTVFKFAGEPTETAKTCTIDRLKAIPQLTLQKKSN